MEILDQLRQYQDLFAKIELYHAEMGKRNDKVEDFEKKISEMLTERAPHEERMTQGRALARKFESDVADLESKITKSRDQLASATQASEYSGLKSQIEKHESEKVALEENLLAIFSKIEEIELGISDLDQRLANAKEEYLELKSRVSKENQEFESEISQLSTPLEEARSKVDAEVLEVFDRLQPGLGSNILVNVDGSNCGGCHVSLAPQILERIRQKKEVVFCNFCGRILECR
ncbi:MAG: hypothetical protein CBC13_00730 [Planctomycetia bacterium TMED53]|nr:MAG: hypothetical protein CBC13_00730 [Planctomycetia bacterium TMED53]